MKIQVSVKEIWDNTFEIEVDDLSDEEIRKIAIDKVNDFIDNGEQEGILEYNYTLDTEQWTIVDEVGKSY